MRTILKILLLSAALLPQPLLAAEDSIPPEFAALDAKGAEDASQFMMGNVIYVLFHEAGHMLVSELDLPVLGREEDAVDTLSSVLLLEAKDPVLDKALMDSVESWLSLGNAYEVGESDFMDAHGLSKQRAYNIACMMVGQDQARFKDFADGLNLPQTRRDECEGEYQKARASWFSVLEPHLADDKDKIGFRLAYAKTKDKDLTFYRDVLKEAGVLEMIRDTFSGLVTLKPGIRLTATVCGQANAFWSPGDRELTYCFEDARSYVTMFQKTHQSGGNVVAATNDASGGTDEAASTQMAGSASSGPRAWLAAKFSSE